MKTTLDEIEQNKFDIETIDLKTILKEVPDFLNKFKTFRENPKEMYKALHNLGELVLSEGSQKVIDEMKKDIDLFLKTKNIQDVLLSMQRVKNLLEQLQKISQVIK